MYDIQVQSIVVKKYRIVLIVKINGKKYSDVQLKDELLKNFPSLADHKCKNASGQNFVDIMDTTSIAHILEHLIIDYQINYFSKYNIENQILFGTTEWLDKEEGIAKIELSYYDDIIALKAINLCCSFLSEIQS